jgi:hypothetical protein
MMNGLVDEIETAWRAGRVVDVSPEDVAKMRADAEENYKRLEAARESAKGKIGTPQESVGLIPDPDGKSQPPLPTDPQIRNKPLPSKKQNR